MFFVRHFKLFCIFKLFFYAHAPERINDNHVYVYHDTALTNRSAINQLHDFRTMCTAIITQFDQTTILGAVEKLHINLASTINANQELFHSAMKSTSLVLSAYFIHVFFLKNLDFLSPVITKTQLAKILNRIKPKPTAAQLKAMLAKADALVCAEQIDQIIEDLWHVKDARTQLIVLKSKKSEATSQTELTKILSETIRNNYNERQLADQIIFVKQLKEVLDAATPKLSEAQTAPFVSNQMTELTEQQLQQFNAASNLTQEKTKDPAHDLHKLHDSLFDSSLAIEPKLTIEQLIKLAQVINPAVDDSKLTILIAKSLGLTCLIYAASCMVSCQNLHPGILVIASNINIFALLHKYNETGMRAFTKLQKQDLFCLFGLNSHTGMFLSTFFIEFIKNYSWNFASNVTAIACFSTICSTIYLYFTRTQQFQVPGMFANTVIATLTPITIAQLLITKLCKWNHDYAAINFINFFIIFTLKKWL